MSNSMQLDRNQRHATVERCTRETDIQLTLNIDGQGQLLGSSGVGFLDHMLELFCRHARFDLQLTAQGDTHVDDHHVTEDIGISLGQALARALGDKRGINRYGQQWLPMDETLVTAALDLSGRGLLVFRAEIGVEKVGTFDTQLVEEFFRALADQGRMTLHIVLQHGQNGHHIIEAMFKAVARALRQAVAIDQAFADEVPSTKGTLSI